VIGGSQKILADIANGMKTAGHDIQIWSTYNDVHDDDFEIGNVTVHPELKLRGSFPATHQISPADLIETTQTLRKAADWANRIYLHADAVYLRHALEGKQIIRSIHDYMYEEALLSTLILPADITVVPSEYLKDCIEATVAHSGRKTIEPVIVIPNGVLVPESLSQPVLPDGVSPREENDLILLFPHRPEPAKGAREAFQAAVMIQNLEPSRNVRLLMPSYLWDSNLDESAASSDEILQLAEVYGASTLVELHGWLSPAEMPGYYAAGDVTLCIGSFVESFGLVPVESVANGTPAVCANVGALRRYSQTDGISMVPFMNFPATANAVLSAVTNPDAADLIESGRFWIATAYSQDKMISEFEDVMTHTIPEKRQIKVSPGNRLKLAPWCYVDGEAVFDDYTSAWNDYPELTAALQAGEGLIPADPLLLSASLDAEVRYARERGILIPDYVFE
jgi:glycosyltransferase involved in cell wall biosynthesis